MARRLRRPGSPWRILVHEYTGRQPGSSIRYGTSHDISNDPAAAAKEPREWLKCHVLAGTEFDELVIGNWIHLEQLTATQWYCAIGGVFINITADRDGRPVAVDVFGPGEYDEPREGVAYSCTWTADS